MMRHFLFCLVLGACSSASSTGISPITCPADSTLTYDNFGSTLIGDHCLACHASRQNPTLSAAEQVRSNRTLILQEAVYTDAMPEDANMALAEREMRGEWLACGAP